MPIGPIVESQTRPSWVITIKQADNSPLNISGATFTGVLRNKTRDEKKTLTVGNYAITDAAAGIFTYSPVSADVDTPGTWVWQTKVTISGEPYIVRTEFEILEDLSD